MHIDRKMAPLSILNKICQKSISLYSHSDFILIQSAIFHPAYQIVHMLTLANTVRKS